MARRLSAERTRWRDKRQGAPSSRLLLLAAPLPPAPCPLLPPTVPAPGARICKRRTVIAGKGSRTAALVACRARHPAHVPELPPPLRPLRLVLTRAPACVGCGALDNRLVTAGRADSSLRRRDGGRRRLLHGRVPVVELAWRQALHLQGHHRREKGAGRRLRALRPFLHLPSRAPLPPPLLIRTHPFPQRARCQQGQPVTSSGSPPKPRTQIPCSRALAAAALRADSLGQEGQV